MPSAGSWHANSDRTASESRSIEPFVAAVRDLERDGVPAIVTSCGFLAAYQAELAAAISVPVFASPLLRVPMAARGIRPDQRVALFTDREVLSEHHFSGAGWSAKDVRVVQVAPPPHSHFVETFVGNAARADPESLRREVAELTERVRNEHPDVGAVVLECANFSPFRRTIRDIARVPVFDLYTLGMHAYLATDGPGLARDSS